MIYDVTVCRLFQRECRHYQAEVAIEIVHIYLQLKMGVKPSYQLSLTLDYMAVPNSGAICVCWLMKLHHIYYGILLMKSLSWRASLRSGSLPVQEMKYTCTVGYITI